MVGILVFAAIIGFFIYAYRKTRVEAKSRWQHFFDGMEFSTQEFYQKVETAVRNRNVSVDFGRETFLQTHIFSAKREYLRVSKGEYIFYICAAPFGTGTFVSEWLCIKEEQVIDRIPILNKLAGRDRSNKTFYQTDTEAMYRSAIHTALMSVIDEETNAKGIRGLTDIQRAFQPSKN